LPTLFLSYVFFPTTRRLSLPIVLDLLLEKCKLEVSSKGLGKRKEKMFTLRRFALAVISLPIALAVYAGIYFGLFLVSGGFASYGLLIQNFWAVGFGWVVAVTFSKQILDLVGKLGA